MRLLFAVFTILLSLSAGIVLANEDDHAANDQTISVTFGALKADPENPKRQILAMTIRNDAAVSVILRGVATEGQKGFKLQKSKSLFGNRVWSDAKFVQINPGKSLKLDAPTYKLLVPNGFAPSPKGLRLDFGVKGQVWVPYK